MRIENPFHEGELAVQQRAGVATEAGRNGRMLADSIITGALKFFAEQPMVILGSVDDRQDVWASLLFGRPGFMTAPDENTVEFDLTSAGVNELDPLWANIENSGRVGVLVMELATRRRLRVNGEIARPSTDRMTLSVAESFPNCPKYIQRREVRFDEVRRPAARSKAIEGSSLGADQSALIQAADTFFVASSHYERGVDVSHRGGPPGFVEVMDEQTLRIPDYIGNSMFQTLGNLSVNPRAGLVLIDFDRGAALQLTGRAEILWDQDDVKGKTGGTKRFWNFKIDRWLASDVPAALRWEFVDYSPNNPQQVSASG